MCLKRAGIAILYFKKTSPKFCLLETDLRNSQPVLSRNLDLSNFGQTLDIRLKPFCYGRKKTTFHEKEKSPGLSDFVMLFCSAKMTELTLKWEVAEFNIVLKKTFLKYFGAKHKRRKTSRSGEPAHFEGCCLSQRPVTTHISYITFPEL